MQQPPHTHNKYNQSIIIKQKYNKEGYNNCGRIGCPDCVEGIASPWVEQTRPEAYCSILPCPGSALEALPMIKRTASTAKTTATAIATGSQTNKFQYKCRTLSPKVFNRSCLFPPRNFRKWKNLECHSKILWSACRKSWRRRRSRQSRTNTSSRHPSLRRPRKGMPFKCKCLAIYYIYSIVNLSKTNPHSHHQGSIWRRVLQESRVDPRTG